MPTKRNAHAFSDRPRPALLWALVEFHGLVDEWLKARRPRAMTGCRAQVLRCLLRATTAFNRAAEGIQKDAELERVRQALLDCEIALVLSTKALGQSVLALAMNRIDQLMAGLDELESLDPSEWNATELPALATVTAEGPRTLRSTLRQIAAVVAAALKAKQTAALVSDEKEKPPSASTS